MYQRPLGDDELSSFLKAKDELVLSCDVGRIGWQEEGPHVFGLEGMEFADFRGHVRVSQGGLVILADEMVIREEKLLIRGNARVTIQEPNARATASTISIQGGVWHSEGGAKVDIQWNGGRQKLSGDSIRWDMQNNELDTHSSK